MSERFPLLALLTVMGTGCGLLLDLDPVPAATRDAGAGDASPPPLDGGTVEGGRADAGPMRDGGPSGSDAALRDAAARDASAADAGVPSYCTPQDCDGDGSLEELVIDPDNCGTCGHACEAFQICCNGECAFPSACSIVC